MPIQDAVGLNVVANTDVLIKDRASQLVGAANIAAITSWTSFSKQLPRVKNIAPEQWDFFVTVAGVFIAVRRLHQSDISESSLDSAAEIIIDKLTAWRPDARAAFEDCHAFYDRTYDGLSGPDGYEGANRAFIASDSVGAWIVWNLLGRAPDGGDERQLVRGVGVCVVHSFFSWWEP